MYSRYKKFIEKYVPYNFIEWSLFQSRLSIVEYKKGETILHIGEVCRDLHFIDSGLARGYMIGEDGKDYTWSIFFNDENSHMINLFVIDYDSFINRGVSSLNIEVLEDCRLITMRYEDVEFLYNRLKKGERFGRLMSQEAYTYLHRLMIDRQLKSAKERFDDFMRETPYLLDKVPQYHIATFLGITPQHLSRLKKGLT
jgi:CRP-like cAMP-binding protein